MQTIGIDASNIRCGGGLTHLTEFLAAADPAAFGFTQVIVWAGKGTLDRLEDRPWLLKARHPLLEKSLPYRIFWQRFLLSDLARKAGCCMLYVPGGSYAGDFQPVVTFSQNLLPFVWKELMRFGWSFMTLKFFILRQTQLRGFRRSAGVVFLTEYARSVVMKTAKSLHGDTVVVPHGINHRFMCPPREQFHIDNYSTDRPFRLLYVSIVDMYKHQWRVAEAVVELRHLGLPVVLDLVGPAFPPALKKLQQTLRSVDPDGESVRYLGTVPHAQIEELYAGADLAVFASSCETFGQILIEAMSAGLPIACSNRSAMPELLGDAGVYFDPENPKDIATALEKLIADPGLRTQLAERAYKRAQAYSWHRCAKETLGFLSRFAKRTT